MKNIFCFLLVSIINFAVISTCPAADKVYTSEDITFNNSIAYDRSLNTPVNGVVKEYSESGVILSENSYRDGKKNGIAKGYFDSGALMIERYFKDGEVVGVVKVYYESGVLAREQPFKDGKLNGEVKEYSESGALKQSILFKDGKVITESQ
jgi:antitoxin component YwqK of YwqJK toxin-antitoxin module